VEVNLTLDKFVNNKYSVVYGNKEALFTIIDEEFAGLNNLGRINKLTVLVKKLNASDARLCTTVIGLGNGCVGVMSNNPELKGNPMNKDNMEQCTIILYEDW